MAGVGSANVCQCLPWSVLRATAGAQPAPSLPAQALAHHWPAASTASVGSRVRSSMGAKPTKVPSGFQERTPQPESPALAASTTSCWTGSHARSAPWLCVIGSKLVMLHVAPASCVTANVGRSKVWPVMR
ncbi:MAG: hypothetical protein LC624_08430 [Halobacteriales archaeon]|nr:hypothetical protein [Halobacteriales archaeon]